ncbi:hypothetical protein C8F01DRAFT_540143 [Mycena amicta]|nr:hypothetical protein C8F01DRAFT_540143 [Mycena amicta]
MKPTITITTLDPALSSHTALIPALVDIHVACIEVDNTIATFTPPLSRDKMVRWWEGMVEDARTGRRVIFLAFATAEDQQPQLAGYVILYRPRTETGPFRGPVEKLLVSPSFRRLGIARQLMEKLEEDAKVLGQTLLTLDTETGSPAEIVYPKLGYNFVRAVVSYSHFFSLSVLARDHSGLRHQPRRQEFEGWDVFLEAVVEISFRSGPKLVPKSYKRHSQKNTKFPYLGRRR